MSRKGTSPRSVILARREKVKYYKYYLKKPVREIAEELGFTDRTIWNDIKVIEDEFAKELTVVDVRKVLHDLQMSRRIIQHDLTRAIEKLRDSSLTRTEIAALRTEIVALKTKDDIEARNIEDLQELGFIEKPTDHIEVSKSEQEKLSDVFANCLVRNKYAKKSNDED